MRLAAEAAEVAGRGVESAQFVVIGIGDIERAAARRADGYPGHAKRMLHARHVTPAIMVAELEEIAPSQRAHLRLWASQINLAHTAYLAIGDVEADAIGGDATRLGKRRLGWRAIGAALGASASEDRDRLIAGMIHPNLMRSGHRDVELILEQTDIPGRIERRTRAQARPRRDAAPVPRFQPPS